MEAGAAVAIAGTLILAPQVMGPNSIANAEESSTSSTPTATVDPTWTATETATDSTNTVAPVDGETTTAPKTPEVTETTKAAQPNETAPAPESEQTPEPTESAENPEVTDDSTAAQLNNGIAPLSIPDPTATTAVISVKVGGDRLANGTVGPLAGVKLGLYGAGTATTGGGGAGAGNVPSQGTAGARYSAAWTWTSCVSDADGDCNFVIPIRSGTASITGAPQDTRFWVVEEASPAGWYSNPTQRVGIFAASPEGALQYRFRTDTQLRAGTTYRSTDAMPWNDTLDVGAGSGDPDRYFMRNRIDTNTEGWYAANVTRTTGVWNQSRNNPVFPAKCGINVALITDTSGSLTLNAGQSNADYSMTASKNAMSAFVDAFQGTDSKMSLFSFSNVSPGDGASNHPALLPVTTAAQGDTFKSQYAGWRSGGGTNWDRGFAEAANASAKYDLAVLFTDGNPTVIRDNSNAGSSAYNSFQDTDAGIFSANQLKAEGTRVVALGVGPALTANSEFNLRAVSGLTKGSDYFRAGTFAEATAALVALANANCAGSIEVQKMIVPANGTIADATPAPAGWTFDAASQTPAMTIGAPTSKTTVTGGNGKVDFGLNFASPATSGTAQILETQQPGYQIVPVGTGAAARNGTCQVLSTGASVPVTNSGTAAQPGFTVTGLKGERVSCKIYNTQILAPGKLDVAKSSDPVSGTTVTPGQTLTYTLTFKNTGGQPVTVDQEDVLTGVLDDAVLLGTPVAQTPLSAALNGGGDRIRVTGVLAPGDMKTVTYQVKVKDPLPATADATLGNFVVKTGDTPPPTCEPNQPCTVHPVRVSLTWNKVDPSGNKLDGSEWKLVPLDAGGAPIDSSAIAVTDCVASSASQCTGADRNPAAGEFSLIGLTPGSYWLVETKAPAGYQLLTQEIEVSVDSNIAFGDIENELMEIPSLPLTGGVGSDLFKGAALGALVLVGAALIVQRRRSAVKL